ncbi:glycine--tRNA ligase [Akkermansia sp. N21116]|uniref:glycine--tRNA ligase n=1 Tax=Akkermansia sp. N21116 TaxID=3040764 RepID=UPI00244EE354|nr:glycine--tRNA ligase [Akkermansia sp. N21116]WPX41611.1 glycine--tRNA ligase [Akkermansia sp. N21116]
MADRNNTDPARMEKIVSLCKRRGFIFQSAELYGGLNGCWDYGPLGAELKRNVKEYWWRKNVQERDDIVGMDGSILTHNSVLVASGHVGGFTDPMCDCLLTKERLRADQVPAQNGTVFWYTGASRHETAWSVEKTFAVLVPSEKNADKARKTASQYYAQLAGKDVSPKEIILAGERTEEVTGTTRFNPANGSLLTEAREFNLMFKTKIGATSDDDDPASTGWLRPETAQSIFCQYKNILDSSRVKIPFGIAQIGKAFRNEINPRNFTFRSREFEQMEIEYFCREEDGMNLTEEWLERRLCFYDEIGIPREHIHILDVPAEERAFYSKKTYDLEYEFPFGIQELEGIAYRTCYDLSRHQEGSGKTLEYFDEETKERFIPHVVEPSSGCDRTILALICEAFEEEQLVDDKGKQDIRTVMHFHPRMAPIKAAIFPLLKKNEAQVRIARDIERTLQPWMNVFYDEAGAVGRRYRRQDEVGTPFCITVDFETLGENDPSLQGTVTIRHRDSMEQERVAIDDLLHWLIKRIR